MADYEDKTRDDLINILKSKKERVESYSKYFTNNLMHVCVLLDLIEDIAKDDEDIDAYEKIVALSASTRALVYKILEVEIY